MTHSVLVVDDEPMARTLLRLMLVRSGFEVLEAADGLEAIAKLKEQLPDIMILDVMMPGIDGFAVCEAVRQEDELANLPIIMLSAKTDSASVRKGIAVGATKYLTKPISQDELTQNVMETLNSFENQEKI